MITNRSTRKRIISALLSLAIVVGLVPALPASVQAEIANPARVEIFLAADAASNNLSLDGFESALKADMQTRYGYPADKVFVTSVESQNLNASSVNWNVFDHTNYAGSTVNTPDSLVQYYAEPYIPSSLWTDRHILISSDGTEIKFLGYGQDPLTDFLYNPDTNPNNKVFQFVINESMIDYHTLSYGGFLFNASYTYSNGTRTLSGYVLGVTSSSISLYRLTNVNVNSLAASSTASGVTLLSSVAKPATTNGLRYLKIVASPSTVSAYQFSDSTYGTLASGGKIFENYALPASFGAFGYGPYAAYSYHGCPSQTKVIFNNLTISTNTSTSFVDTVRSINWQFKDSLKLIVNVDNDGVNEFGNTASLSTILYYMGLNNAHYAGWGINNPISIGSDTTVMGQAANFIARNLGKGMTINRSLAQTDSLGEGVAALSDYILDKYDEVSPINPPNTRLTFGSGGAIQISVTDTQTSAGNPIGACQWRYMNVATGTWTTSASTASAESFTFSAGTYNMVSVKIQDAVTGVWSDYTIAYIANDTSVQPIAQFSLGTSELMPDSSIDSLKTGWSVTANDLSYHPAGSALTAWEWKVYNSTLVEQTGMASTAQKPTFDFTGKPAGTYTIKLRVKTGTGSNWSNTYTQSVTLFRESSSISISRTAPSGSGPFAITNGSATFSYSITGTNPISRYRVLRLSPADGEVAAEGWQLAGSTSVSDSGTVTSNTDIYVQALDSAGNSKTALIGEFRLDMVKPVLSVDTSGYTPDTWSSKPVTLSLSNTAANTAPVTLQYRLDSGSWTAFNGSLTVSSDGSHVCEFRATSTGGVTSDITSVAVKVDRTAPTNVRIQSGSLTFDTFIASVLLKHYFSTSQTFKFTADANVSGLAALEYQLLDRSATYQAAGPWTAGTQVTVDPTRDFVIYVRATDNAGNQTVVSTDGILIENTAPSLAIEPDTGMILFKNSTEYTKVTASDAGSGLKEVTYTTDEAQNAQSGTVALAGGVGYIALSNNGAYTLTVRAVDLSGNVTTASRAIKIDKTVPTISVTGDTASPHPGDTVAITAAAGLSGVAKVEVRQDSGTYADITASHGTGYGVSANGTYTFRVTSGAGSTATASITYTKLDPVQPVVSISAGGYTEGAWTRLPVSLTVGNASANLGTTTLAVSTDGVSYVPFNGTLKAETEGETTYSFRATSAAGVVSEIRTYTVRHDKTAPTGTVAVAGNAFKQFLSTISFGLFYKTSVDVTITGADASGAAASSGVDRIEWQKVAAAADYSAAGPWTTYAAFSVSPDEQFIIYARITDKAGNSSVISSDGFITEATAPVLALDPAAGQDSFASAAVTTGVQAADGFSGLKDVTFTTDETQNAQAGTVALTNGTGSITLSNDGAYTLTVRAVDLSGNVTTATRAIKIDKTAPTISVTGDTASPLPGDTVTITAAAGLSGVAKVEVRHESGAYADITASYGSGYRVSANGTYTFRVTSGAGRTATASIAYAKLDPVQPVVSISANGYTEGAWTRLPVSLTIGNTSANLGTTALAISTDGVTYVPFNGTLKAETEGETTYSFRATSAAGVVSEIRTFAVRYDKTAPTGTVTVAGNAFKQFLSTISFGLFYKTSVDVTITGADASGAAASSGVDRIEWQKVAAAADYSAAGPWTTYAAFSVSPDEQFIIYARITDKAGNSSVISSDGFITEATAPALTLDPAAGQDSFASAAVTTGVQAADGFSGLKEVTYTTDEAQNAQSGTVALTNGTGSITLSNDGAYTLTVRAVDLSGNVTTATRAIKIDKTAPVLEVSGIPDSPVSAALLTLKATVGVSGVQSVTVSRNGGDAVDLTGTYPDGYLISDSGRYVFTLTSSAGLASQTTVDITNVDPVQPVASISAGGYTEGAWSSQDVTFQIANAASNLGQPRYEYRRDDGDWTAFDGKVTESAEGVHTYQFRVTSAAGVVGEPVTYTVNLDKTRPAAPAIDIRAVNGDPLSRFLNMATFKLLYNQAVRVTLSAADAGSGLAGLRWTTQAGAAELAAAGDRAEFDLPTGFSGKVSVYAIDKAGLRSETAVSEGILLEQNAPAITTEKRIGTDSLTLGISLKDDQSGLRGVTSKTGKADPVTQTVYAAQTAPVTAYGLSLSLPWTSNLAADYDVTITAQDLAGNSSVLQVSLLPEAVTARIRRLPDPAAITNDQLAAATAEIKAVRSLYDLLTTEQKKSLEASLTVKLDDLYARSVKLIIVAVADVTDAGSAPAGTAASQVIIKGIDANVIVPELANPAVEQVTIQVNVEKMDAAKLSQFAITAENKLAGDNTQIVQYLDLSLIKFVKQSDGKQYSTKVENSQITGYLTIMIPLPAAYESLTNLHIVYIDDQGGVTPFVTKIVDQDGQKFLQFETNHFSVYAIAGDKPASAAKTGAAGGWLIALAAAVLASFFFLILFKRRKKEDEEQEPVKS